MKPKYIIFFFLILIFTNHSAQKYNWVNQVFNNIIDIVNNPGLKKPRLIINKNVTIANYNSKSKEIHLDIRTLEICREFDDDSVDCLAFILGHEIMHHYMQHGFIQDNQGNFNDLSFMESLQNFSTLSSKRLEMEVEADFKGGFYTYLAGYNSLQVAPKVLDTIYKRFEIPNSEKYPSLKERKEITYNQLEKIETLKNIYNSSIFSTVYGNFKFAINGFEKILEEGFVTKEILNNVGVLYLKEALKTLNNEDILLYPFEFDTETRLNYETTRGGIQFANQDYIRKLIENAIDYLNQASKFDFFYQSPKINLICAYSILAESNREDSQSFNQNLDLFELYLSSVGQINESIFFLLNGILEFQKKNNDKAISFFKKSALQNNYKAKINLEIIDSTYTAQIESFSNKKLKYNIDGINLNSILYNFYYDSSFTNIKIGEINLIIKKLENSDIFILKNNGEGLVFQQLKNENIGFEKNIKVGISTEDLENFFDFPPIIFNTTRESYYFYKIDNVIFKIKNGIVKAIIYCNSN